LEETETLNESMGESPNETGSQLLWRWLLRTVLALAALTVLIYAGDFVVLQAREHMGSAHGSVTVDNADVVNEKGGKVEYFFNPPQPTPCVRALFPHEGQSPCWWLARHPEQQRTMN
jgi:hypothetical protein